MSGFSKISETLGALITNSFKATTKAQKALLHACARTSLPQSSPISVAYTRLSSLVCVSCPALWIVCFRWFLVIHWG